MRWPFKSEESGWDFEPEFGFKAKGHPMAKNTICVWYDKDAEGAARFYAKTFPHSAVGAVLRSPNDYPSGNAGDVLTVEFTVAGADRHCRNRAGEGAHPLAPDVRRRDPRKAGPAHARIHPLSTVKPKTLTPIFTKSYSTGRMLKPFSRRALS